MNDQVLIEQAYRKIYESTSVLIRGDLYLDNTPISKQYSVEQLKQMLPNVKGSIY